MNKMAGYDVKHSDGVWVFDTFYGAEIAACL